MTGRNGGRAKTPTWYTSLGKDNIVFHCIVFPAMLKAHGGYVLPDNVPANEFLNLEGDKISTSRNWAVWLEDYLADFPGQQDVLRYALCANAPETKDNDFTWKDFQARNNSELVAIYGNFVNRSIVLTHKYFDGKVPAIPEGALQQIDKDFIAAIPQIKEQLQNSLENFRFRDALKEAMNMARLGNKYLNRHRAMESYKNRQRQGCSHTKSVICNCVLICQLHLNHSARSHPKKLTGNA
jgi:methionyl-tRNA synthetase